MMSMPASDLPVEIKTWFEQWFTRELKSTDKITAWAHTPDPSNSYWKFYEKMKAKREARLNVVAAKMRTLGMSEEDITCVLRGGHKDGESYFLRDKNVEKLKEPKTNEPVSISSTRTALHRPLR